MTSCCPIRRSDAAGTRRRAAPAVAGPRGAARASSNRKIGVIGTDATIRSGEYTRALRQIRPELEIYARACPLFVPLAEEGWVDNEVAGRAARLYLKSLAGSGIDTLI